MKANMLKTSVVSAWRWVRSASGDDAYERYLSHHALAHPDAPTLSPRAFYEQRQQRRWGGINRCC